MNLITYVVSLVVVLFLYATFPKERSHTDQPTPESIHLPPAPIAVTPSGRPIAVARPRSVAEALELQRMTDEEVKNRLISGQPTPLINLKRSNE